jgi:hypothetical protein
VSGKMERAVIPPIPLNAKAATRHPPEWFSNAMVRFTRVQAIGRLVAQTNSLATSVITQGLATLM